VSREDGNDFTEAMRLHPAAMYCFLITTIFGGITGRLLWFHLYLLSIGLTTNEELCGTYNNEHPFNKGFYTNITELMFGPRLPGRLEPRHPLLPNGAPYNRPLRPSLAPLQNENIEELSADDERAEMLRFREMRRASSVNSVQSGEIADAVTSLLDAATVANTGSGHASSFGRNLTELSTDTGGYAAVGSMLSVSVFDSPETVVTDLDQELRDVRDQSAGNSFVSDVTTMQAQLRRLSLERAQHTHAPPRDAGAGEGSTSPDASNPLLAGSSTGTGAATPPSQTRANLTVVGPAMSTAIGAPADPVADESSTDDQSVATHEVPVVDLETDHDNGVSHTEVAI
jgi:hypothetical protein